MTDTGKIKIVEVRVPTNGQVAMIDTLRFTIHEETWNETAREQLVGDEEFVRAASRYFEEIFGFGVTADMRKGRDFYLNAWELGDGYGYVAFGGERQQETMLVNLTGQGCIAAKPGWEGRLYEFLTCVAKRPTITRVDLAHDCMDGEYSVDDADRWFDEGLFTSSVVDPTHEHRGNWRKPNGRGRSLYIGSRRNGKLCRVYEKGREQGDADSEWVRFEVEVRNQKRVIPLDVLVDPSGYFVGSYPCLLRFQQSQTPKRIEVKRQTAEISLDRSARLIHTAYGKHIAVLRGYLGDDVFLDTVTNKSGDWPDRLKVPDYEFCETPIHHRDSPTSFNDFYLSKDDLDPSR
jgi:phage replication initiation protein